MHTAILRGAMVSAYIREEPGSDAALWLAGAKTADGRETGIGHLTVQALREIGLLDEVADVDGGLVSYPRALVPESPYRTVGINGVWRSVLPADVDNPSRQQIRQAKQAVKQLSQSGETLILQVRDEIVNGEQRKVAYDAYGKRFGTMSRDTLTEIGDNVNVRLVLAQDGDVRGVYET